LPSARVAAPSAPAPSPRSSSKAGPMRDNIQLACGECKRRTYTATRNKKKQTERLEEKKYCKFCRRHTLHKEVK
jgi:large subunit ribosomal protein L33